MSDGPMFALIMAPTLMPMTGAYLGTLAIHRGLVPVVAWPGLPANMAATLGALVGSASGELWLVEIDDGTAPGAGPYDTSQSAAYGAWADEMGTMWNIRHHLRSKRWVEWEHELKRAFVSKPPAVEGVQHTAGGGAPGASAPGQRKE